MMKEYEYDVECGRCGRTATVLTITQVMVRRQLVDRNWHRVKRSWRCPNCAALATLPRMKTGVQR